MRARRIVMLDFAEHDLEPDDWSALRSLGDELVRARSGDPELAVVLRDADVLLAQLGVPVGRAVLDAAPRLRYVGVFGTSTGRIDPECARRGIAVRNVPGFSTEAVAELALAIVLDHLRDLSGERRRAAGGDLSEPRRSGGELRGRRIGVIGLGPIGRRVAEIAREGFGADVRGWSRTSRPELGIPLLSLDALLRESEMVTVHLALTTETRGVLHGERIARLPDHALLVLLSPPELVDLAAVMGRLAAGSLFFVTDHGDEMAPRDLDALRVARGCTLLPPIGYATSEARAVRRERFVAQLAAFLGEDR